MLEQENVYGVVARERALVAGPMEEAGVSGGYRGMTD